MKRIVKKFNSFQEAEDWEIVHQIEMKPTKRQEIARELRKKFYGDKNADVREIHKKR